MVQRVESLKYAKKEIRFERVFCRVTRRSGENLGPKRSLICSIGDVFGGSTRFCVFSDLIGR